MNKLLFSTLILVTFVAGCAGYEGATKDARSNLLHGNKQGALKNINTALKVEKEDELPPKLSGENALLLLERASIKQGLGKYKTSSKDFQTAEKHLELLDLSNDTMGNIGKFLFSDDSTKYKAPAYEKLMLNTLNMLNYLSIYNLENARVESRRLTAVQDYLKNEQTDQISLIGLGNYLSGFTFEMSGRYEQALQFYVEAMESQDYPSLKAVIKNIAGCTGYRTSIVNKILDDGNTGEISEEDGILKCDPKPSGTGTILVVVLNGLAPHKIAKRIPIGLALTIAAHYAHGPGLSASQNTKLNRLKAKGLLTWINFPEMKKTNLAFNTTGLKLDQVVIPLELGMDVTASVIKAWDSIKGTLMVAAITRMITRLLVSRGVEEGMKAGGGNSLFSLFAGLAVQGTMTAADTPDTRSWTTLPATVELARIQTSAGKHFIEIKFEGKRGRVVLKREVEVPDGGFVIVPAASMR